MNPSGISLKIFLESLSDQQACSSCLSCLSPFFVASPTPQPSGVLCLRSHFLVLRLLVWEPSGDDSCPAAADRCSENHTQVRANGGGGGHLTVSEPCGTEVAEFQVEKLGPVFWGLFLALLVDYDPGWGILETKVSR